MQNETDKIAQELKVFEDSTQEWRRIFAELWGTLLLVIAAAAPGLVSSMHPQVSLGMGAAAPGIMLMVIIYMVGAISGAHVNPAVTLGFAVRGIFPWKRVPLYIVAQVAGATLAAVLLYAIFGLQGNLGATVPADKVSDGMAIIIETVITMGLVNVVLSTAQGARNIGNNGGIAIGGYLIVAGIWAGALTGGSVNIARTLGPDIIRGNFNHTWIYAIACIAGAVLAAGIDRILKGKPTEEGAKAAQGSGGEKK